LLVVIAVTVGGTILFIRDGSDRNMPIVAADPNPSSSPSDFASANDKGPVKIITEDPTCAPWVGINNALAGRQNNGWRNRDPSSPAVTWRSEVRQMFTDVGEAFDEAADQTVPLVKMTPHRVMRELYEQFIAYSRAYSDSLPLYTEPDNHLANVAVSTTYVLTNICSAVDYGSAAARAPLVTQTGPSVGTNPLANPMKPKRFLTSPNPICSEWSSTTAQLNAEIAEWTKTDPNIPASQWSADQRALTDAVVGVLQTDADTMQSLGTRSSNPTLQDFAELAAMYQRAFVQSLPTYAPDDQYLFTAASQAAAAIHEACLSVES
jgi:hypothetical protein